MGKGRGMAVTRSNKLTWLGHFVTAFILAAVWLGVVMIPEAHQAWADCEAADPIEDEAAAVLNFARHLLQTEDHDRALGEVKRFIFHWPSHARMSEAQALLAKVREEISRRPIPRSVAATEGGFGRLVGFYRQYLRSYRSPESGCPSHPGCSEYAWQAVDKHGLLLGMFILVDRLWREVTNVGTPPQVMYQGRSLRYDPLIANDHWLTGD